MFTGIGSALVLGAASLGGSMLGNSAASAASKDAAKYSYRYSKRLAEYQNFDLAPRAFARQMQTLKENGVNPILAYGELSSGAPGVSQFNVTPAQTSSPDFSSAGSAYSSAQQRKIMQGQLERQALMDSFSAKNMEHNMHIQDVRAQIQRDLADAEISLKKAQTISESAIPEKIKSQISESLLKQDLMRLEKDAFPSAISLRNARIRDLEEHTKLLPEIVRKYGSYVGNPHVGRITLQDIINFANQVSDWVDSPSAHSGKEVRKRKTWMDVLRSNQEKHNK